MTAPRAVGVRTPWAAVPETVRAWVESTLGAPVAQARDQVGGMSPGCATRLRTTRGERAFVKAVGRSLNPDTPTLFRREAHVLELIGRSPRWAGLRAVHDDGDWIALLLDDVEGGHPDLADDATMTALLEATDDLAATLAERVPRPPTGGEMYGPRLVDVPSRFRLWADALADPALAAGVLPAWVGPQRAGWAATLRDLADGGGSAQLVHWDLRVDNLIQRPDGAIVVVDWGMAGVGPGWVDPLLARLERVEQPWFDDAVRRCPPLAALGDDAVTAWLAGFAVFLAHRAEVADDVGLPTLKAFRRTESARFLGAVARRTGR